MPQGMGWEDTMEDSEQRQRRLARAAVKRDRNRGADPCISRHEAEQRLLDLGMTWPSAALYLDGLWVHEHEGAP